MSTSDPSTAAARISCTPATGSHDPRRSAADRQVPGHQRGSADFAQLGAQRRVRPSRARDTCRSTSPSSSRRGRMPSTQLRQGDADLRHNDLLSTWTGVRARTRGGAQGVPRGRREAGSSRRRAFAPRAMGGGTGTATRRSDTLPHGPPADRIGRPPVEVEQPDSHSGNFQGLLFRADQA
jgi:hypothetical protein